ncbi:non-specific lipid-transfer protein 2-like [Andrographis paniculata]|uniref:non-specific lipid-transfer protein 2-like n=1 Tax=Andrographis paniculata TaxID=175694 RepID=UPI0021E73999|nr:non-specific lipid-transfer protein 2-like [Andrographis paniculata]
MGFKSAAAVYCVVLLWALNINGDGGVEVATAVTCNPMQLSPCAQAIMSSENPSKLCCQRVKEQRPCLCGYMRNPNLQKFVKSAGAQKVASYCRTPFPKC